MKHIATLSMAFALCAMSFTCCADKGGNSIDEPAEPTPETPAAKVVNATTDQIIYEANARLYGNTGGLNSLKDQLPELKAMGTDIVWIMPLNTPGEEKSIGSPYCVKDYDGVDPKLGTKEDLISLVETAHGLGMKVILDWVANHTAWDHPWTKDHPEWYVRDGQGNIQAPGSWTDVAELNYNSREMRAEMTASMLRWLEIAKIDGFRFDNVDGVPGDYWKEAFAALRAAKSDVILLSETSQASSFSDGADMIYGWAFGTEISKLFNGKSTPAKLIEVMDKENSRAPEGKATAYMRYCINHDIAAEHSVRDLFGSPEGMEAAYAVALFAGSTPMFYTSQFCDFTNKVSFFNYSKADFNSSKMAAIKKLNAAFKQTKEVRQGQLRNYTVANALMYEWTFGEQKLIVVVNLTKDEVSVKMPMALTGIKITDLLAGTSETTPVALTLKPYQYCIYKK